MASTDRHVRLTSAALGSSAVLLSMQGFEALGRISEFHVEFLSLDNNLAPADVLGKDLSLTVDFPPVSGDGIKGQREFNGIITLMRLIAAGDTTKNLMARYHVVVHPRLWLLTQASHRRFYYQRTVREIVTSILAACNIDFRDSCTASYPQIEHCVQYRETDFDFVSRLLEREGIYYFFEYGGGKHTLVLTDSNAVHRPIHCYESIPFIGWGEADDAVECVYRWMAGAMLRTGIYEVNDYDFEKASVSNQQGLVARATRKAPYDPPQYLMQEHVTGHLKSADGDRLALVNAQICETLNETIEAHSSARGIAAGGLFKLTDHPSGAQNRQFLVTETRFEIYSDPYVSSSDPERRLFDCKFCAIRADNTFRPARTTPVPRVAGPQTAVVVGPDGEEILTDKYGRVKVQFHWEQLAPSAAADRLKRGWVRVAQGWANKRWGAMVLPRIGQEVLVEFIEGDPDRPVITGAVYNSTNMPPYELPANSAVSTLKSNSTKGGNGFNEMRCDDRKGEEQFFFHAEKDLETWVKHDTLMNVGHERHLRITGDEFVETGGARNDTINGDSKQQVRGSVSHATTGAHKQFAATNYSLNAGIAAEVTAGATIVIQAATSIALRAGTAYILIGPETIEMSGPPIPLEPGPPVVPVNIPPPPPTPPTDADDGTQGVSK